MDLTLTISRKFITQSSSIENLLGQKESTYETSPTHRQTNITPSTADAMVLKDVFFHSSTLRRLKATEMTFRWVKLEWKSGVNLVKLYVMLNVIEV